MKKSQRLRLAALVAQTNRSAAEETELASLQALAARHPDASKDEDDTAGAAGAEPGAKAGTVEGFMAKFTAAISAKQKLAADLAAANARILALEAGNVGTVTLAAVLAALNLKSAELAGKDASAVAEAIKSALSAGGSAKADDTAATDAAAQAAQITTLTTERDTANASLAALAKSLGLAVADFAKPSAEAMAKFALKDDEEWKKLTAAQQIERLTQAACDHAISARAVMQVKELGFNATQLPAPKGSTTGETLEEVQSQLASVTDPAERGRLAAKANKLRDAAWAAGNN